MKNESALKNAVRRMIKKEFPWAWVYCPSDKFTSGIPDVFVCLNGYFVAIELKMPRAKPRPLQAFVLEEIRQAGGISAWATDVETVRMLLLSVPERRLFK